MKAQPSEDFRVLRTPQERATMGEAHSSPGFRVEIMPPAPVLFDVRKIWDVWIRSGGVS